ncbi:MAG: amidohydrolase family protein [Kiritimatiellae bacterium]|nr:amidohydrolase family protein [Kiritimatiellia bacterium]
MEQVLSGFIVDGTGAPGFFGDAVVEGDRIKDIVRRQPGASEEDAPIVSPGFIDAHTHSDAYLVIEPGAPSKISQGITTEINGQCGGSVAPRYGEARLSSDWAALLGERLVWRSLAEYREVLSAAKPAVNTVQFIGHNTLRSSVVGYAARAATTEEQKRMERLLEQSLDEGGWGLTTGLIYQPGRYSTPEEVTALARVAAKRGGIYATHMRSEGDRILESIDEVIALARETGIKAEISHLKTGGKKNWGKLERVFEKIEGAMAEGLLLGSDRYPYCAAGTDLDVVLPDWAQEGAAKAECARLADPELRAKIAREIDSQERDWASVMIGGTWSGKTKRFSGKRVSEICESERTTPGGAVCEILALDGCKTGAFFFTMCEENLDRILAKDWILPGSDASLRAPWGPLGADHPHPRAYGTMPEFYRRLRALGVSREKAVARMTGDVARRFGIKGRGVIKKGAYADLAVWDEKSFASNATYLEPHRFSSGVRLAMVNGVTAWRDGRLTGERGGRFLERR